MDEEDKKYIRKTFDDLCRDRLRLLHRLAEAGRLRGRLIPLGHRRGGLGFFRPAARGGARKHRAVPTLFGSRPKKPKGSAAATKQDEAAAKAARFRKVVKQPQAVSA